MSYGAASVPMVRAAVGRKLHLFAHFHDLHRTDLVQEATLALRAALPSFDPLRGSLSTFVAQVCGNTLIDILRQRSREAKRQAVYSEATWGMPEVQHAARESVDRTSPLDALTASEPEPEPSLCDWLSRVYCLASRATPGIRQVVHKGRHYRVAQVLAVGLLMHRETLLSAGECRALFKGRPDLCRAIHFARPEQSEHLVRVPGDRWFEQAWILCAQLLEQPGAREALAAFAPTLPNNPR